MVNRNSITGQLVAAFLLGAAVVGLAVWTHQFWQVRTCNAQTTSPTLCRARQITAKKEYTNLQQQIKQLIQTKQDQGSLKSVSVYFRDLDAGPIFEVNQYQDFIGASLLKIPVMLTFLKYADTDPNLLKQVVRTPAKFDQIQVLYPPKDPVLPNTDYTVETLIKKMITQSDNQAGLALENYAQQHLTDFREPISQTLVELGMLPRTDNNQHYFINIKEMASMIRAIYNASYLSLTMSRYALNLMSETDFKDGLVSGVPTGIRVAHKFGLAEGDRYLGINDIGIVYGPRFHYLLGVMTNGISIEEDSKTVSEISRMVWEATQK
jgi:beta-lactamase class A